MQRIDLVTAESSGSSDSNRNHENLLNHNVNSLNIGSDKDNYCFNDDDSGSFNEHYVTLGFEETSIVKKVDIL